jgi:FKBP-type peptidyl-prolyl cis-trans isomerase FklB
VSTYTTNEAIASYGIGLQMGQQILSNPFEGMEFSAVVAGVNDALSGNDSQVAEGDIHAAFQVITEMMKAKQAEDAKVLSVEGTKYLEENAKRDEITVTESGLQYEVLTTGEGDKPTAESTVKTHYHGTLIDGTVFDSSYDRGQAAEFPVGGVIAGWTEALQMMTVGSKWRLHVPHNLAYGERGAGGAIQPYSTLIFDVELLEIVS